MTITSFDLKSPPPSNPTTTTTRTRKRGYKHGNYYDTTPVKRQATSANICSSSSFCSLSSSTTASDHVISSTSSWAPPSPSSPFARFSVTPEMECFHSSYQSPRPMITSTRKCIAPESLSLSAAMMLLSPLPLNKDTVDNESSCFEPMTFLTNLLDLESCRRGIEGDPLAVKSSVRENYAQCVVPELDSINVDDFDNDDDDLPCLSIPNMIQTKRIVDFMPSSRASLSSPMICTEKHRNGNCEENKENVLRQNNTGEKSTNRNNTVSVSESETDISTWPYSRSISHQRYQTSSGSSDSFNRSTAHRPSNNHRHKNLIHFQDQDVMYEKEEENEEISQVHSPCSSSSSSSSLYSLNENRNTLTLEQLMDETSRQLLLCMIQSDETRNCLRQYLLFSSADSTTKQYEHAMYQRTVHIERALQNIDESTCHLRDMLRQQIHSTIETAMNQ
jgi:hypothetical protein